jgi:hypothetical protein
MKLTKLSLALFSAAAMTAAMTTGVANAATPTLSDVLGASGITATGFVDAGYYHFDTTAFPENAFQSTPNTFDLQQASLTLAMQPKEGFGALVNVTAGSNAKPIASIGSNGSNNFDVTQAFVQYAHGPITVIGGKFLTLLGAEVIASNGNTNISRSIEFFNTIAYTHTGVRATYAATDTLSLIGGVNNGWDQQQDTNKGKTLELGVAWNPAAIFSLAAQGYVGQERTSPTSNAQRSIIDAVITVKPIAPLALVLNVDYAKQKEATGGGTADAKWTSVVGYVNYQFTDKWRTSLRLESFDDKDNYRMAFASLPAGVKGETINSITLTGAYAPTANSELRAEYRMDKADDDVYVSGGSATDKVNFFALEGIYKF